MRKRTNVGGWTEGKVEEVEGSTGARKMDENGCTEVRKKWRSSGRKVTKPTNVGGWTEGEVKPVEGRKDEIGCSEVRNTEEVPAFIQDEKYWRKLKNNRQ